MLFNRKGYLNLFCDASSMPVDGKFYSCSGAIAVHQKEIIDNDYQLYRDSTNSNGEIKAIRSGVLFAIKYKDQYPYINLFSDSLISILGIRERIFKWKNQNGELYGKEQNKIANQSIFIEIAEMILYHQIHINFWFQRSHVNERHYGELQRARDSFVIENRIPSNLVTIEDIKYLSYWNNKVDNDARKLLTTIQFNERNFYRDPVHFHVDDTFKERLKDYQKLIQ